MSNRKNSPMPPAWATRFLTWFCAPDRRDEIAGDLLEEFYFQLDRKGARFARLDYIRGVIGFLRPFAVERKEPHHSSMFFMMVHYFEVAYRNIKRHKTFSIINVAGLSIGLCCCMLLLLYTKNETSYDTFHINSRNIYQLVLDRQEQNGKSKYFGISGMVQGPAFQKEIPEIENYVRVRNQTLTLRKDDHTYAQEVTWADKSFFSVFSFPLLAGQPPVVLNDLHSVVLTSEAAKNIFGKFDVVDETIELEISGKFETFTVSGIAENAPENSSIKFALILPFSYLDEFHPDNGWHWVSFPTYFQLYPKADPTAVARKMESVYALQAKQEIDEAQLMGYGDTFHWSILPFISMHLNPKFEGTPEASDPLYSIILSAIAIFILIVACINFINLTVAQSIRRAKEIGVRKVLGGQRKQLVTQFLAESFLITLFAFGFAALSVELALPFFNTISGKHLDLGYLMDWHLMVGAGILLLITSLMAGIYPALILSGLQPIASMQNQLPTHGRTIFTKGLVVAQFALSSFLIIGVGFIYAQLNFLTSKDLGYNDHNLLEITVGKAAMDKILTRNVITEFSKVAGVESIAPRNIGKFGGPTKANQKEFYSIYTRVDEQYLATLQIPTIAGRAFTTAFPGDSTSSVLVNETFVKAAGWSDPVGRTVDFMNIPGWGDKKLTVVGVVRDYHSSSLHEEIKPEIFTFEPRLPLGKFMVRINPANTLLTLAALETAFHHVLPNDPFHYSFKDNLNRSAYHAEMQWKKIITIACVITISIACLGLLAMTAYSTQRRSKEIAMRKVLGASSTQILAVLSKEFIGLVLLGFMVSVPAVYYATDLWLRTFAYSIGIGVSIFLYAGVIAMGIAFITITAQCFKSINSNPANSLRND